MGFNSVYQSLLEVFPQVDVRVLKAVAIEHSKDADADAAVEFILLEVLPSMSVPQEAPHSLRENRDVKGPSVGGVEPENQSFSNHQQVVEEANAGPPSKQISVASEDANDTDHTNDALYGNSTCMAEAVACSSVSNLHSANDHYGQICLDTDTEELISLAKHQEISVTVGSDQVSTVASSSLIHEDTFVTGLLNDAPYADFQDLNGVVTYDSNSAICRESHQDQSCLDSSSFGTENSPDTVCLFPSPVNEETPDTAECGLLSEKDSGSSVSACEKPGISGLSKISSEQEVFVTEMLDVQDKSTLATIVNRSGRVCRTDLLENTIRDAKNNKKTLFSAMESVINMMREVELQEKVAEQAKEEASRGGLDILARVEDLKQMLRHAKEANDMHAGEVYGEKSILATEMWELQSRLFNLSDERDKSFAILDEMHQTLEARLVAAEEERKAAEQDKVKKEESARKALAEQELIMEKVVQESKKLQLEAEENFKLQEFLMDRGRIVDILQGEMAVICQDVKLLKEKFDEGVPLSKSVSSSHRSCILASSSLSVNSMASDRVPEQSESLKKSSPTPSLDGRSQKSSLEEEGFGDNRKVLLDDDWDLLDV